MDTLFHKEKYLTIYLCKEKNYIMFKWRRFGIPVSQLEEAHQTALVKATENNIPNYMAETSEATETLLPAAVQWWAQTWVPKLRSSVIKTIVTVVPHSALASFSTKDWQAVNFDNITLQNAKTVAEAEALLAPR